MLALAATALPFGRRRGIHANRSSQDHWERLDDAGRRLDSGSDAEPMRRGRTT